MPGLLGGLLGGMGGGGGMPGGSHPMEGNHIAAGLRGPGMVAGMPGYQQPQMPGMMQQGSPGGLFNGPQGGSGMMRPQGPMMGSQLPKIDLGGQLQSSIPSINSNESQLMPVPKMGVGNETAFGMNKIQSAVNASMNPKSSYYDIAKSYLGQNEASHYKPLTGFFKQNMGVNVDPRNTAWCAAFANSVINQGGGHGTGSLAARSFLNGGEQVKPGGAQNGDVVVFSRGSNPAQGHVGFYAGETETTYKVLGGNQGDSVSIKEYPKSRLLGIRRYSLGGNE